LHDHLFDVGRDENLAARVECERARPDPVYVNALDERRLAGCLWWSARFCSTLDTRRKRLLAFIANVKAVLESVVGRKKRSDAQTSGKSDPARSEQGSAAE
jgi:hypothetical protein